MNRKSTKKVKAALLRRRKKELFPSDRLLGTGSTKFNLACSGRIKGGFPKGKYVLLAGESDSGKTWVGITALAEAANDPDFEDYRLIYDPTEGGADMDVGYFFGDRLKDRIELPAGNWEDPHGSRTVEELYDRLDDLIKAGDPFVYVVDSETALQSEQELGKIAKQKKARLTGDKEKGSYQGAKQKYHSTHLSGVVAGLRDTKSILIFISQLRQNMGMGNQFQPWVRPGGLGPKYYAAVEAWIHLKGTIKTEYRGKKRQQGQVLTVKIKRTRITGKKPAFLMTIYHAVGIDDVGDNINYLVEEKHWSKVRGVIHAKEFRKTLKMDDLIRYVEDNDKEKKLALIVGRVWRDIDRAVAVQRKPRYQ